MSGLQARLALPEKYHTFYDSACFSREPEKFKQGERKQAVEFYAGAGGLSSQLQKLGVSCLPVEAFKGKCYCRDLDMSCGLLCIFDICRDENGTHRKRTETE